MIGYKATYGDKCKNITYEIGKTYKFNGELIICFQGFHFCKKLEDVFLFYYPEKDIKVYKIKVLGNVIEKDYKSVTDKFQLIEETDVGNLIKFDKNKNPIHHKRYNFECWHEYDESGNEIYYKYIDSNKKTIKITYELWKKYDQNNNLIYGKDSNGAEYWNEYDENNNLIYSKDRDGNEFWYKYDENNNLIYGKSNKDYEYWYKYDNKGNKIYFKDIKNNERIYEYDERGNEIYYKDISNVMFMLVYERWSEYDENNNLISFKDNRNRNWSITIT